MLGFGHGRCVPMSSNPSLNRLAGMQATLVAAWLTELHLDTINRALLEVGGRLVRCAGHSHQMLLLLLDKHLNSAACALV